MVASQTDIVYLIIDTQEFEDNVSKGAKNLLKCIDKMRLEMSLTPLCQDESLFDGMHHFLCQRGYGFMSREAGFTDEQTGQLLQFDGILHRM